MSSIDVKRAKAPVTGIVIHLDQYEDRKVEEGENEPLILVQPYTGDPECFEFRVEAGWAAFNKGQMKKLGQALIDFAEQDDA